MTYFLNTELKFAGYLILPRKLSTLKTVIGKTISHYRITEKLGEGGMGVVYKAHDTKLDRDVALKFLPTGVINSPEEVARFEREAKAISALNHPNIATIYDVDEADGEKFLVLEYIPGGTLKTKIKNAVAEGKELPLSDVINLGIQIADGLGYAHRHEIIHRDVKSDNVMLSEEEIVKITDFGLAKLRGTTQITKTGSTIGTAAYMSPEQLRGEDVDQRADLFSFGVVMYELLALHMPFRGEHEAAVSYSIANEPQIPLRSFRTNLPQGLEQVIGKCLEKNKEQRYQTAEEIAADLRAIQQGSAVSIKKTFTGAKMLWLMAGGLVLIGAVCFYLLMPSSHQTGANSKTIAVLPFENMSDSKGDEYFSDGVMEDILTQLSKIADLNVISRTSVMQYKGTQKTVREIGKELGAGFLLEGSVRHAGNRIRIVGQLIDAETDNHVWAETYDSDLKDIFEIQSDVAQKIAAELQATLTPVEKDRIEKKPTENLDAYAYYLRARQMDDEARDPENARKFDWNAIQLDSNFALAFADMGANYAFLYSQSRRKSALDSAFALDRKALSIDSNLAEAYNAFGIGYGFLGDTDNALKNYQKAVALNPSYSSAIFNLGGIYYYRGDYGKALKFFKKAIALNPVKAYEYIGPSLAYGIVGDMESALRYVNKAAELGERDTFLFITRSYLLAEEGKPKEALAQEDSLRALNPGHISHYSASGGMHLFCGELQKAKLDFEIIVGHDSASNSELVEANNTTYLGYILLKLGDTRKAETLFAYSAKKSGQDIKDYPKDPSVPYDLAALSAIKGNKDEAYKWLHQVSDDGYLDYRLMQQDPLFENLRNDAQFKQMLESMKLKVDERREVIEVEDK